MSLSKRDTIVRYMDPLRIIWEDAEGGIHYSIESALKAFGLEDTQDNRSFIYRTIEDVIRRASPNAELIYRDQPDNPEEFVKQKKFNEP